MRTRRVALSVLVLISATLFICGMSGGIGGPGGQNTVTSIFSAKITDNENTDVNVKSATIDGKTYFSAYLGKGKVQIPFDNITQIDVSKGNACISLANGKQICNLKTNEISRLYGVTSYGNFQISLRDVKRIIITKTK